MKLTIERERGETYSKATFAVYEHGTYGRSSVLAGRPKRIYRDGGFSTVEEAKAKYPNAKVLEWSTHIPMAQMVSHLPDDSDY